MVGGVTTISIIECNPHIQNLLYSILADAGYEVSFLAGTGEIGLELLKQCPTDIVICSRRLPDMCSYKVLWEVRKQEFVPFIFLCDEPSYQDNRRAVTHRADYYLSKPFSIKSLVEAVQQGIEKKERYQALSLASAKLMDGAFVSIFPPDVKYSFKTILGTTDHIAKTFDQVPLEIAQCLQDIQEAGEQLLMVQENLCLHYQLNQAQSKADEASVFLGGDSYTKPIAASTARERAEYYRRVNDLQIHCYDCRLGVGSMVVHKILKELIDNAFKFSSPGTLVKVQGKIQGNGFLVSIYNQGDGMTLEEIHQIAPFVRFSLTAGGMGLGLSVTRSLLDLNGGQLSFESEPQAWFMAKAIFPLYGYG